MNVRIVAALVITLFIGMAAGYFPMQIENRNLQDRLAEQQKNISLLQDRIYDLDQYARASMRELQQYDPLINNSIYGEDNYTDEITDALQQKPDFTIRNSEREYQAFHGGNQTGDVYYSNVSYAAVLTHVFTYGMASGRTWYEKVTTIGNITQTAKVTIPSWVIYDLSSAEVTRDIVDQETNLYENSERTSGNNHILILLGHINGARNTAWTDPYNVGYCSVGNCFIFENVSDLTIYGGTIERFAGNAIGDMRGVNNRFVSITGTNCGGYGFFEQTGEKDCRWINCTADGQSPEIIYSEAHSGFNWCTSMQDVVFLGCTARYIKTGYGGSGFADGGVSTSYGVFLIGCVAEFCGSSGFMGAWGAEGYTDIFIGCIARNNNQDFAGVMQVGGFLSPTLAYGCIAYDDQLLKTQDYGADIYPGNFLVDCAFRNNKNSSYDVRFNPIGSHENTHTYYLVGRVPNGAPSPAFPSSGASYQNKYGRAYNIVIYGGNVTAVRVNNVTVESPTGLFNLDSGDTISITYTGPANWTWTARS